MPTLKPNLNPKPNYKLIGHRGSGKLAPENTLAAFKMAKALGLNWVEFDTQLCGSGEWVVIHDPTLERTTNGTGSIEQTALKTLKSLDAGSWFNPKFHQESIPLLDETLALLSALSLQPNIEIKGSFSRVNASLPNFFKILKTHWPKTAPLPLISSFNLDILLAIQQKAPDYPLGYIARKINSDTITTMITHHFFSLHCDYRYFQPTLNPEITDLPFPLLLYTVNEPELAQIYFQPEQGVSAIFSDFPNLFIPKP